MKKYSHINNVFIPVNNDNDVGACLRTPDNGNGPWPGVVVIHDALGMSADLMEQTEWLASAGYLAAAPDLFNGKTFLGCMREIIRDFSRKSGPMFDKIEATRLWLKDHPNSNGRVGVIGFCFGGGMAMALAPDHGFAAASINYGPLPSDPEEELRTACPIVGSYGAKDGTLKGAVARLEEVLTKLDIPHDIKEYPHAGHSFQNNHDINEMPLLIRFISYLFKVDGYNAEATMDARRRIIAFFNEHLQSWQ